LCGFCGNLFDGLKILYGWLRNVKRKKNSKNSKIQDQTAIYQNTKLAKKNCEIKVT